MFEFFSSSTLSLDAKGRLSVPTRHHEELMSQCEGKLVITVHYEGCLMVMPLPVWETFRAKIAALPMSSLKVKRLYLSNAMPVELDATGRILISPELRQEAGIVKETSLRGMGNYFELWDKATYDAQNVKANRSMQEAPPSELADLSI